MKQVNNKVLNLRESYQMSLEISDDRSAGFKKMCILFIIAYIAQGVSFTCFFPVLVYSFGENADPSKAFFWLGVMASLAFVDSLLRWFAYRHDYHGHIVDITNSLRVKLGKKLRTMPLEILYSRRTGELNSVLANNVEESVMHMGVLAGQILQTFFIPFGVLVVTVFIDWRLAGALLLILPMAIPVYKWRRRLSQQEKQDVADAHAEVGSDIVEYIQGVHVLRALNMTGEKAQSLQTSLKKLKNIQKEASTMTVLPSLVMAAVVEIGLLVVLVLGAYLIKGGSLTIPVMAALLVAVSRLTEPLSLFVHIATMFDIMGAGFGRIKELMGEKELDIEGQGEMPDSFEIEFEGVDFLYKDTEMKALDNVSLKMEKNSMTALVGPSGSGKTTIAKMIMRYADPAKGSIKIGGKDIRSFQPDDLMKMLSVVFQDVYLFDDTILNNIRMGRPDATDEEVMTAARSAYCHEFIQRLPDGYGTKAGDIGGSLSGGEKQRISIARAILKDAPIVILDEPTAALDTESELAVQRAIDALVYDRTVIVIAHRLSTIAGADSIIVMDEGRVRESGCHSDLLKLNGKYKAMWESQKRVQEWQIHVSA
ncbi:ABC transporter related protein [Denitrovibrio acetiphilus DSM 12809]|uniref:ABC transporter related protein n=1 Tax=Denitrovibrio acetiphilus (strain DSM 12809 / NBRC 114555 / N2460) TaxID=522772 RepID=D4H8M0_DENA2|nr:ABC transporter ATP-binding protein [Denitrovibrio acetiphilus]ADD68369.1 ABC transporter related protein [Denitrovibrio acetiphilus DSM 12809]